jgi:hypothetical protein
MAYVLKRRDDSTSIIFVVWFAELNEKSLLDAGCASRIWHSVQHGACLVLLALPPLSQLVFLRLCALARNAFVPKSGGTPSTPLHFVLAFAHAVFADFADYSYP